MAFRATVWFFCFLFLNFATAVRKADNNLRLTNLSHIEVEKSKKDVIHCVKPLFKEYVVRAIFS